MENENGNKKTNATRTNTEFYIQISIIAVLVLIIAFNFGKIYGNPNGTEIATGIGSVSASEIIPKGMPAVYGSELGISYDDVSADNPQLTEETIAKLTEYEDMQLNGAQMERYIKIGSSISCEYCCGAKALIFPNGERACGCAHSYAMRGLAKYLLVNHPDMSDLEILNELGKWKVLFFPGVHEQKAEVLKANNIDYTNQSMGYVYLASNIYRGIENQASSSGSSGGMVGGC